ncbi:RNA-binding protein 45-like [Babylonia areolata]|uniref:RNA-binding protein 45-like n=1 Tax=Babylonia areolata TaxID=304850 RepID=UPI003FCF8D7B
MAFRKDAPPNSRLFILCQKGIEEREFREHFGEFGGIEDVWIVKDKRTNEDRGIVYISFRKTSEAMLAMENMNGRCMPGQLKPLKVVVANTKREGSTRDPREDEKLVRLFVVCPKTYTEKRLREHFEPFGDLQYVTVMRDKSSGESKGFGYIKYHRPYHAALAYELCNRDIFKPRFAEPQRSRDERENKTESFYTFGPDTATAGFRGETVTETEWPSLGGYCQLQIVVPIGITQDYLSRLFNLVPGLEYCDLNEPTGLAYARYATPQCAVYARDKLNGFEYPLGSPLAVMLLDENTLTSIEPSSEANGCSQAGYMDDLSVVRQRAASVLEKAGISPETVMASTGNLASAAAVMGTGAGGIGVERVNYCSLLLPLPQPLASDSSPVVQRLFIVCQPSAISERVLRDAFSRFGNLIDVFLLAGRNYGYAKYTSKESAMKAIQTLHGQILAGQRIKVLEAEPPKGSEGSGEDALYHTRDSGENTDKFVQVHRLAINWMEPATKVDPTKGTRWKTNLSRGCDTDTQPEK